MAPGPGRAATSSAKPLVGLLRPLPPPRPPAPPQGTYLPAARLAWLHRRCRATPGAVGKDTGSESREEARENRGARGHRLPTPRCFLRRTSMLDNLASPSCGISTRLASALAAARAEAARASAQRLLATTSATALARLASNSGVACSLRASTMAAAHTLGCHQSRQGRHERHRLPCLATWRCSGYCVCLLTRTI